MHVLERLVSVEVVKLVKVFILLLVFLFGVITLVRDQQEFACIGTQSKPTSERETLLLPGQQTNNSAAQRLVLQNSFGVHK